MLRVRALAALTPIAQDVVVAGHDRSEIGLLIFPNLAGCRQRFPELDASSTPEQVLATESVRAFVSEALAKLRGESSGSSLCAARALFLSEPPSIDAGEITDKAYLNQRQVLLLRAERVAELYSSDASVIHSQAAFT